jgi:hypothetical protein
MSSLSDSNAFLLTWFYLTFAVVAQKNHQSRKYFSSLYIEFWPLAEECEE